MTLEEPTSIVGLLLSQWSRERRSRRPEMSQRRLGAFAIPAGWEAVTRHLWGCQILLTTRNGWHLSRWTPRNYGW